MQFIFGLLFGQIAQIQSILRLAGKHSDLHAPTLPFALGPSPDPTTARSDNVGLQADIV